MNRLLKLVLTLVIAVSCVLSSVGVSALPNVKQLPQSENLQDTSPTSYPPSVQSGHWTNPTNAYASNNTYATFVGNTRTTTSSLNPTATTNGTAPWLTASNAYSIEDSYAVATYNIPTERAVGTVATGNSTSLAIGQPTGTTSGDVLLCFLIDYSTTNANSTAPAGWKAIGYAYVSGIRFQLFSAVSGKNGLTGTSWTFGTTLTARCEGVIIGFYGVDNSGYGGIDTPTFRQNASGTTGTTSITTTAINEMVIGAFASSANGATWSSETTGTMGTLIGTEWVDSAYSTYSSIAVAGKIWTSSGSTGASSATMSANTTNCGILLALKPASTPIQFISAGAASNGTTGSISPALPAGLVPDDVCVLVASTIAGGSITKKSNGSITWNAMTGSPIDVTSGEKLYVWWGRYSTGSTAPTLTPGGDHSIGQIFAYRGVDTSATPIDVSATGTQASTSTAFSFVTGLTTGTNNDKIVVVCSSGVDSATAQFSNDWTNANLTDISVKSIIDSETSQGGGGGFGVSDGNLATAGAVGTWATTLVTTSTQAYICFAFKPSTNYNMTNQDQIYGTFGITGSATITKVELGYDAFATATQKMNLYTSANGGSTWSGAHLTANLPTSDSGIYTYVDVTADQTWTWTLLNDSNFKYKVVTSWVNGVPTFAIRALIVRVTYFDVTNCTQSYTTYGISLDSSDSITKVELGIEAYASSSETVNLDVSKDNGSTWSTAQTSSALAGSDPNSITWFDFTSYTTWTYALLADGTFQARIKYNDSGSLGTVYLDYIPVRVTYVIPPVGVSASMTGASNQNSTADEGWEATGSVSNTPDSSNLGYLFPSTTYYASGSAPSNPVVVGNCPFTITNCGTAPINLMIRCSDWTGGNTWIIVSGTPTGDQIKMVAYYEGENPASGLVLSNSDQDFYDNLAVGSPIAWLTLQDSGGSYKTLESSGDVAVLTLMADVGAELNWGFSILTGGTDGIFSDTVTKTGTITITAY